MAGIEKVCEFSGESRGGIMYEYKRNRIQVFPEYRKLFKGKEYKAFYWHEENFINFLVKGLIFRSVDDLPSQHFCENNRIKKIRGVKILKEFQYCIHVPDLSGEVHGWYVNYSYDMRAVKHNLKKILGVKKIEFKKVKGDPRYDEKLNYIGHIGCKCNRCKKI